MSRQLLVEYRNQIREPRNDFVRAFFDLLSQEERVRWNWKQRWSGADREKARDCRFPEEDDHVLRTAILTDEKSLILSEEARMVAANGCIYKAFRVRINDPCAA
jgi:hypothetical protein